MLFLLLFYAYNGCFLMFINRSLFRCYGDVFVYTLFLANNFENFPQN